MASSEFASLPRTAVQAGLVEEQEVTNDFRHSDIFNDLAVHRFNVTGARAELWRAEQPQYDPADTEFIRAEQPS